MTNFFQYYSEKFKKIHHIYIYIYKQMLLILFVSIVGYQINNVFHTYEQSLQINKKENSYSTITKKKILKNN